MPTSRANIVIHGKQDMQKIEQLIAKKTPVLLLYHARWCPHCVDFVGSQYEPSRPWQQICNMVNTHFKGKVYSSEVEESNMQYLSDKMNQIRGFPTLVIIKQDGGMLEYQGSRTDVDEVKTFIEQATSIKGGKRVGRTTKTNTDTGSKKIIKEGSKRKTTTVTGTGGASKKVTKDTKK